jgi:hypothetical protein
MKRPYVVRREQTLFILIPMPHRDPKVWGADAVEFQPDHFSFENTQKLPPNAWTPFGNGQWSCIGRPFALQEATLLLAMMMQRFDLAPADPEYALEIIETLTMKPAGLYIHAWEVWDLKLHADLVILSACETGRGASVTGEGLIGLTRAWQYAGAKTVVSSQGQVDDGSTSALMVAFHKRLLAGSERVEALRLAMNDVAKSGKSHRSEPHHWAALIMVGETGKL